MKDKIRMHLNYGLNVVVKFKITKEKFFFFYNFLKIFLCECSSGKITWNFNKNETMAELRVRWSSFESTNVDEQVHVNSNPSEMYGKYVHNKQFRKYYVLLSDRKNTHIWNAGEMNFSEWTCFVHSHSILKIRLIRFRAWILIQMHICVFVFERDEMLNKLCLQNVHRCCSS